MSSDTHSPVFSLVSVLTGTSFSGCVHRASRELRQACFQPCRLSLTGCVTLPRLLGLSDLWINFEMDNACVVVVIG